ncbi:unnamed protein product [Chironomus riparius]|uniref:Protein HGH1 homolog n=1 Tax=Chironomus riparius TaxID=315576 RepID=A0A9N9RZB2_9DIPT|nr:unnamed protein product [Chironomus riparius]
MENQLAEVVQFLQKDSRIDLKSTALANILGLTGDKSGVEIIYSNADLLRALVNLLTDESHVIAKDACFSLINITAENDSACEALLNANPSNRQETGLLQIIIKNVLNAESQLTDPMLSILSNLSRPENLPNSIVNNLLELDNTIFDKLVSIFSRADYNKQNQNLNYLAAVFSNLSQSSAFRNLVASSQTRLLQRLLPFISHESSVIRRGGITGFLKNICFDSSLHEWLFSTDVDVLPFILLPLAGPEEFDDETNEQLPIELQFLESDKTRESDPDIRTILLESLAQLCATRNGRLYLRNKGTYEILRELHKFELTSAGDMKAMKACEDVVDILIRTEDEIGYDNLKQVEISDEMVEKIEKLNE